MRKKHKSRLIKRRTPQVVKYTEHHDLVFDSLNGSTTKYTITNRSSRVLRLSEIHINWPSQMDALFNIFLGGQMIWSGADVSPPTDITAGWIGAANLRDVDKGDTSLEFFWGSGFQSTGFTLEIIFDNDQSVYIEH